MPVAPSGAGSPNTLEKGDVTAGSSPPAVTKEDPAGWGGGRIDGDGGVT